VNTAIGGFVELRREFSRRGWYRKATGRVVLELTLHVAVALGSISIFIMVHNFWLRAASLLLCTMASMAIGTNTHTSSHYATSEKRWLNEFLTYFGYPFFLGVPATWWWHKHVVVHHPSPNIMGVDGDADLLPWFAMTEADIAGSRGWRRFYFRHVQFWFFPVALALNGFNMQKSGWLYLAGALADPGTRKRAHWYDLCSMLLHYAANVAIPLLFFPAGYVLAFYALRISLMGYAMYAVLAPGHFPAEAARLSPEALDSADYLLLQTATSVNFRTGFIGRLVCSGLEYQIEHHLFPNISHCFYPRVSEVVREFCRDHGLPYRSYGWGEVLLKSWTVLRRPQPVAERISRAGVAKNTVA
jgi:fatty acid desaturase